MSDGNKPALRIDWFDGTLVEDNRPVAGPSALEFAGEDAPDVLIPPKPKRYERPLMTCRQLLGLSLQSLSQIKLQLTDNTTFWGLLNTELEGDSIVLILRILVKLYKTMEIGQNSMMVNVLKTKLEKSNFLKTLKEYIDNLPDVGVTNKSTNSFLWEDVEWFFFNVLTFCEGMLDYGSKSEALLKDLHDLLQVTEFSALDVGEEHTERFSKDLFVQIDMLKSRIQKLMNAKQTEQIPAHKTHSQDVNNFKNLSIFPSKDDLLGNKTLQIRPNIINGAYPSVEHYLDIQFKLLREDYFEPLREGICNYMENSSKKKHKNIRVYPKVRVCRTYISNNKVGHLVDIAWKERINHDLVDSKKLAYHKQLMHGALLLFTSDNFATILYATVLDSSLKLLGEGYVAVSFQSPVSKKIFNELYLMVESEVFFEPYHRVLKVLQNAKIDDLPMRKYIVDVQISTQAPAYLTHDTVYSVHDTNTGQEISFPVLDLTQWPTSFGLDIAQMEAFKHALTKEFAVIQGPPGTGKTFIGVKIASTLLRNLSLEGTPMLIICYTNHALDQFLEGILEVTTNVIRLGNQSKNKKLAPYTLNNARFKIKSKFYYLLVNKRNELENLVKRMTELQSEIEKCDKEIVSYKNLKPYLKIDDKTYELKNSKEDPVLTWLFEHLEEETENAQENSKDWKYPIEDLSIGDTTINTCFSEELALKEIDSMMNSIKYIKDVTDDHMELQKMTDTFKNKINKVKKRLDYFKTHINLRQSENRRDSGILKVADLYTMTPAQRWKLYLNAVKSMKEDLMVEMNNLLDQYKTCNEELEEVSTLIDCEAIRSARVVAITTTAAARRHQLMKNLQSPIVIVEEAAEVLEAHIVAALTYKCQHLILIGDHKQLRPTAAHYILARDYNLEISLFERMIRNGIHARCLTVQRRMRPNFVELLVPALYERLDCHPDVLNYPDVRGMKDNLYFYNHDVLEDSAGLENIWSHKNTYEAKWCVALANYLLLRKYKAEEITILTTYTGQASLISELSSKYKSLSDVKIIVVDSYQGEENRIVILSIVRSNKEGNIGFLKADNRICVALSRAKEGFYIFGNMSVLKAANPTWRLINDKLIAQNAIGSKLTLRCDVHKENTFDVVNTKDFNECLARKGCLKVCIKK